MNTDMTNFTKLMKVIDPNLVVREASDGGLYIDGPASARQNFEAIFTDLFEVVLPHNRAPLAARIANFVAPEGNLDKSDVKFTDGAVWVSTAFVSWVALELADVVVKPAAALRDLALLVVHGGATAINRGFGWDETPRVDE